MVLVATVEHPCIDPRDQGGAARALPPVAVVNPDDWARGAPLREQTTADPEPADQPVGFLPAPAEGFGTVVRDTPTLGSLPTDARGARGQKCITAAETGRCDLDYCVQCDAPDGWKTLLDKLRTQITSGLATEIAHGGAFSSMVVVMAMLCS